MDIQPNAAYLHRRGDETHQACEATQTLPQVATLQGLGCQLSGFVVSLRTDFASKRLQAILCTCVLIMSDVGPCPDQSSQVLPLLHPSVVVFAGVVVRVLPTLVCSHMSVVLACTWANLIEATFRFYSQAPWQAEDISKNPQEFVTPCKALRSLNQALEVQKPLIRSKLQPKARVFVAVFCLVSSAAQAGFYVFEVRLTRDMVES